MTDPFLALADFRRGFADGWHNNTRDRAGSVHYKHAYRAGVEARKRETEHKETQR